MLKVRRLFGTDAALVQYIARSAVGISVRSPRGGAVEDMARDLEPRLKRLSQELGAPPGGQDELPVGAYQPTRMTGPTGIGWLTGLMSAPTPTKRPLNGCSESRAEALADPEAAGRKHELLI